MGNANTKAKNKYNAKTYKVLNIRIKNTDVEILEHLEKQKSKNNYVIELIRNDLKIILRIFKSVVDLYGIRTL